MRIACVFLAAVALGMTIGGAISRLDAREPAMIAKAQDRPALDVSQGEVVRAQTLNE